jgi:hypothetical protein
MFRKAIFAVTLASSLLAGTSLADTLITEGIDPANAADTPEGGLSQAAVEAKWGAPAAKAAAVGEPPISSWDYEPFVVYFEYDTVIHTVAKR